MVHLKEEIEHQKEIKARLIKEVGHLDGQKKMLEEEMRVLNEEKKQLTTDVDKLKVSYSKLPPINLITTNLVQNYYFYLVHLSLKIVIIEA